jgi:hypothetical protein
MTASSSRYEINPLDWVHAVDERQMHTIEGAIPPDLPEARKFCMLIGLFRLSLDHRPRASEAAQS